ncbi:MAG: PD40 domain-containing protein [Armatimonadetes bacterium]|nr:PD40 domain-containing protein [Armatimonadota bacterium]
MRRHPFRIVVLACGLIATSVSQAQLTEAPARNLVGARNLALSPDGSKLAFTYRGDIWVVSSKGGKAVPLTNHIEMEDNAVWSPDGKWIAFASNRYGNNDIFAVPAEGGAVQRLTWFSGSEVPSDWSPDGKRIAFRGTRDASENGIYELAVKTLKFKPLFLDMMPVNYPRYSLDGKSVLYTRLMQIPWNRPRYEGSGAAQVWKFDIASGNRSKVRANGFQHLWVSPAPGVEAYCVTVTDKTPSSSYVGKPIPRNVDTAAKTPNVYALDANGRVKRQTELVGAPARFLTAATKAPIMAFESDGSVYSLAPGGKPEKLSITAIIDDKTTNEERLVLTAGAEDLSLSPKNDAFVFQVRGELWSVPVKQEKGPNASDATQLTDWAGLDEQPFYAPDGKSLFFVSDRENARSLYLLNLETKAAKRLTPSDNDVFALQFTPDKKKLSFWLAGKTGGVYTISADGSGAPELVLSKPGNGPGAYAWSPDGRWVAYAKALDRSGYYYWESGTNIWVYDTQEKKEYNVTQENMPNGNPSWSADGKYLYYRSDRSAGGGGGRFGAASGAALYILPLTKEDVRSEELQLKYEKPGTTPKVTIDFDGIENRARRFIGQAPQSKVLMDPEKGDLYFLSEGDLWKAAYDGNDLKRMTSGGGVAGFDFSQDGKQIFYLKAGTLNILDFGKPNTPTTTVPYRADWTRDVRKERGAAFNQFWREYNRSFYDGNFHGRDWAAIKKRYEPLLDSVGHRNEMATLLNMMVGELESSHSEAGPGAGNPGGSTSAHLGFTADYRYDGPGIKIKEVPKGVPGSFTKTMLKAGEIVLQVNGKDGSMDEALYRDVLNDQTGREITLLVNATASKEGARTVKYRAISSGEYSGIVRRNLLEWRRKFVEEKTGGKLTYVHIAGMGGGNFDEFQRDFWQATQGKKGVIIDVRNNGGGNISDRLIDVIERQPNAIYVPRDEAPQLGPGQTWGLPTVVMMGETSFSNAEMFPYAMKARKLATLVGMPTPGYVIYTGGFPLIDGTSARMPGTGVYRLDGSPLEDLGEQPDFKVDWMPEEYFAGKDPQLDKAIEVLLGKVR